LAPPGAKDAAEPKGLAGVPGQLPPFFFGPGRAQALAVELQNDRVMHQRSTAAMVVIGSLKIWSHFEKTRLLLKSTLRPLIPVGQKREEHFHLLARLLHVTDVIQNDASNRSSFLSAASSLSSFLAARSCCTN